MNPFLEEKGFASFSDGAPSTKRMNADPGFDNPLNLKIYAVSAAMSSVYKGKCPSPFLPDS